jgi:hypothetical protein
MLRSGALPEMAALPPGLASSHTLGVHLWIPVRPSAGPVDENGELIGQVEPARSVCVTDASGFSRERLRRFEGDWWHQFTDEPGVTADIADSPAGLDPAGAALPGPMVSVAGLVRAGAVDVILNREMAQTGTAGLRPGDVLVSALDPADLPLVVTGQGGEPTPGRQLLRCDPDVLDPYFLAGFLHSEAKLRQAVTGSGVFRYDVRRAQAPRLPFTEQRRYGLAFRRLAEFSAGVRRAAGHGDDVVRLAIHGLTAGALTPPADPRTKDD